MGRNTCGRAIGDELARFGHRPPDGVRFWGRGQIDRRLGQVVGRLGQPDVGEGVGGRHRQREGVGVGQTNVFRRQDDHAPGDELGILAALEHEVSQ